MSRRGPFPARTRSSGCRRSVEPDQGLAPTHTHRYTIRLETTQVDHEREIARIVRAMGRKKWIAESRDAIPGATDRETVTILTFVQSTRTERAPNAPVRERIVTSGASVPRRFR